MKHLNTGVRGDVQGNWLKLIDLVAANIHGTEKAKYLHMMAEIAEDEPVSNDPKGRIYLGFKRAPAAKGNHHAFEGGLVYHLLEMWGIWLHLREDVLTENYITDARVLKAIINHDLHKAYKTYRLETEAPWQTEYGDDPTDMLMTTDIKSLWILNTHGITLDPEQMNALLWAEGGFAKIKPKWCSTLSKLCYMLDEMSGNVLARIETRTLLDHRSPVA